MSIEDNGTRGVTSVRTEAFPLGYTHQVATVRYHLIDGVRTTMFNPALVLLDAGGSDAGAYTPPSAITLTTREPIRALRDACNVALGE